MMTTTAWGRSFRASSRTPRPSIPGILRSTRRIPPGSPRRRSTAVGPSGAVATVYPSFSSQPAIDSRTISSSSTTRILVFLLSMGSPDLSPRLLEADPAVATQGAALGIHLRDAHRARHHAAGVVAVDEPEGVAQLVDALLRDAGRHHAWIGGRRAGVRPQARRRDHGGASAELRLAEEDSDDGDEEGHGGD